MNENEICQVLAAYLSKRFSTATVNMMPKSDSTRGFAVDMVPKSMVVRITDEVIATIENSGWIVDDAFFERIDREHGLFSAPNDGRPVMITTKTL